MQFCNALIPTHRHAEGLQHAATCFQGGNTEKAEATDSSYGNLPAQAFQLTKKKKKWQMADTYCWEQLKTPGFSATKSSD